MYIENEYIRAIMEVIAHCNILFMHNVAPNFGTCRNVFLVTILIIGYLHSPLNF